jgi:hypothetical protein
MSYQWLLGDDIDYSRIPGIFVFSSLNIINKYPPAKLYLNLLLFINISQSAIICCLSTATWICEIQG